MTVAAQVRETEPPAMVRGAEVTVTFGGGRAGETSSLKVISGS